MSKAANIMTSLLQEIRDGWTFKNDDPDFECYFHSKMFGKITIKDDIITFTNNGFWFDVSDNYHVTCLNDYIAENS